MFINFESQIADYTDTYKKDFKENNKKKKKKKRWIRNQEKWQQQRTVKREKNELKRKIVIFFKWDNTVLALYFLKCREKY